jgi:hypothetical protein
VPEDEIDSIVIGAELPGPTDAAWDEYARWSEWQDRLEGVYGLNGSRMRTSRLPDWRRVDRKRIADHTPSIRRHAGPSAESIIGLHVADRLSWLQPPHPPGHGRVPTGLEIRSLLPDLKASTSNPPDIRNLV